jgi:hypothetical protein
MNLSMQHLKIIFLALWLLTCLFSSEIYAQNAPITSVGTISTSGSSITVPITVTNFTNIGSCNLKLTYNPAIVAAIAVTTSSLPGGNLSSNLAVPGEIYLGWFTSPAMTLPDNSAIFYVDFSRVAAGSSPLTWVDDGYSCQYTDGNYDSLNDTPQGDYYRSGFIITEQGNGFDIPPADKNPLKLVSYPNPFTDHTTFTFHVPEKGHVVLEIMNTLGETLETVADIDLNAGEHTFKLSPGHFGPGIYLAVLTLETNNKLLISMLKIIRLD